MEALDSLSEVQTEQRNGLVPAEVTVVFNITAGSKDSKSATVEIVPTGIIDQTTTIGSGWTSEVTESRGNTITIKFRSILFTDQKELLANKSPKELSELYDQLKKENWNIHTPP